MYTHGHHASVLRSHTWRTAENSAGYLLEHLTDTTRLLDVGCGPATITCDLASRVAHVTAIEPVEDILETARATAAERGTGNVEFQVGSVYGLDFADDTFDVVHAHQVCSLQAVFSTAHRAGRSIAGPSSSDYEG